MNVIRRIAKNNSFLFFSEFFTSISSLIILIVIARLLGDINLGKYTFASAFPQLFTVFIDLGYGTLLVREVARDKSLIKKYLSNILGIRLFLLLTNILFLFLLINIIGYTSTTKTIIFLFGFYTFLKTFSNIFLLTFRAFEKMEYEALVVVIGTVFRGSLGLILLFCGYGLLELAYVFIVSGFIELFFSFIICRKKIVRPRIHLQLSFLLKTIKVAFPLGLLTILGIIYIRIDTVLLSIMKGDAVVGWYNAAYNLILGFQPIPHLFMHSLLPLMSYFYISSKKSLQEGYEKSFRYLFFLGLPMSVGICLLADEFIFLFFGNQFVDSIIVLRILAWDIVIKFLYICSSFVLISSDKQNQTAIIVALSALLNVVLNIILIPHYSYIGAGVATIATEIVLLISYLYLNHRNKLTINMKKIVIKPIIACSIMAVFLIKFDNIQLIFRISIAIFLYVMTMILIKGLRKEDYILLKKLIKKN